MQRKKLIIQLLETNKKSEHRRLFRENSKLLDLELAEKIKDTYYDSWTKEPHKTRNAASALTVLAEFFAGKDEFRALAFWVRGIADLTEGKLEKAVSDLSEAAAIFQKNGSESAAAQTKVSKLIALAMLGRYDEAIETGKNALEVFEKNGDELAAGKIEMNISNILSRREQHRAAEKYCLSARERFQKIGENEWLTMAENGLANTYAELDDFQKAEEFYRSALENARGGKMTVTEAEIEASMGNLAIFRGRYADALRFLELSRRKFETLEMPHQKAIADLEIAGIYTELNLTKEASEIYERVSDTLGKLKMRGEEARARANFGRVAALLNENRKGRGEMKKAARLFEKEKNPVGAAWVKLSQAKLETVEGKYEKAFKIIKQAEKLLRNAENTRHKLSLKWLKAETLRNLGKLAQAEKLLTETYDLATKHEQTNLAQVALDSLGKIALRKKDRRAAEKYFKKAIKIIENLRAPLAAEEFRMSFLSDKLAPFENLARLYIAENKLKDAFLMIEKARSRSLAEILSGGLEKKTKQAGKQDEKLENLREELNWFYSRLNRAEESAEIEKLQKEAKKREKQIADLMRQIESTKTQSEKKEIHANLDFKELQKKLGRRRALVEFVCFDGKFSAFVITSDKIEFFNDLAKEDEIIENLEGLQFQFGALRYGAENLGDFAEELKKRADFYLREIYEKLFRPLEKASGERDLVFVPVVALNYVPFQALFDGENYLIETREISYAPSATVWNFLQKKKTKKAKNALLIGFADEKIPLVRREINALKKIFPESETFTGRAATFSAYRQNAEKFGILHLACHGEFRPDNPLFSSLRLADGFVTVRDVCSQNLDAALVTLSACETGLNKIFAGDEILGLTRGFLSAGANSLILSLWTVSDEATVSLMKEFYTNLQREGEIGASLAKAQREFIRKNAHPYFWSPFVLIGR